MGRKHPERQTIYSRTSANELRGEAREKKLQEAVNRILTKFLEPALEKAGVSLDKEIKGDEQTTAGRDEKPTMWESEKMTTGGDEMKKTDGDEEKKIKKEN
ncbi:hypothetical protein OCU04_010251 [Sclerotinia nivalis]|uniref:Uncharacterized protein n=1 Tax=Sclerotinia nivalis TaxID=352851 RepID=A0A9X0AFD0_9HELO|nr:hypothetical protein OCU04_010251 [Sclerotinia nivalis]